MNLSEVLNVALPELPARRTRSYPRIHPKLIMREQIEGGVPTLVATISGGTHLYRFNAEQWAIAQLFNGERSYRQITDDYLAQSGIAVKEDDVREFAATLEDAEFWYKTPLEKNLTANEKLAETRQRQANKKSVDFSNIVVASWDPDVYLTRMYDIAKFLFAPWFIILTGILFIVMILIFAGGWSEIWRDTLEYYTFTDKTASDLAQFWLLFCALGFFHELAHALVCKHYGGEVHRTGFMLVYLSPAFFADITEVYVYGGKWQRIAAIIAGIWVELMFCSVASLVWWGTPVGSPVHDFAYKIMLITGVAVILMNLNPLIKLDGYYLFGELIGISTIKESSTEYLTSWIKRNVFCLPVEVSYPRRRQRWLFVSYALISGTYSYIVMFAIVRLAYNICNHFSPQWAFLPASFLAFFIFRARLRSSWRFMKNFYLDKKKYLFMRFLSPRGIVYVSIMLLILFAPVWRETVAGRFVFEPQKRSIIRVVAPGEVTAVLAREGMQIAAGSTLLTLKNLKLEGSVDISRANLDSAQVDSRAVQLAYGDVARARGEITYQQERYRSASEQHAALNIRSPISGVIVTPNLEDLEGTIVATGTDVAEVDDMRTAVAKVFIPEFEIPKISTGNEVSLKPEFRFEPIRGRVSSLSTAPTPIERGLIDEEKYKGIAQPNYYVATILFDNQQERILPGMSGDAKINVGRRSLAGFSWQNMRDMVRRKIW